MIGNYKILPGSPTEKKILDYDVKMDDLWKENKWRLRVNAPMSHSADSDLDHCSRSDSSFYKQSVV